MATHELQEWANRIDIGKDKKSDKDFVDIKNKLVKDMENLWNLKLQGKITQEEYSRYGVKFREILEKDYISKKDIEKRYELTRKQIMNETKSKTQGEQKGLLEKLGFETKDKVNLRKNFGIIIEEHNLELMAQIYDKGLQNEFRVYFSENPQKRKKFLIKLREGEVLICPKWIKNQANNQIAFEKMIIDLEKIELDEKIKRNKEILIKRLNPELGNELIKNINDQLQINPCKFNLIKTISDFNKKINGKKIKKLTNKEILSFVRSNLEIKETEISLDFRSELNTAKLNPVDFKGKTKEQKLLLLNQNGLNRDYFNRINGLEKKLTGLKIASNRAGKITEKEVEKIINLMNLGKTNKEIMDELEKKNKELKKYNDSLKNNEKPEQTIQQSPQEQKISSQISSSSIISIPSDFGGLDRKDYFKIVLESVQKSGEKEIKNKFGLNIKIFKYGNKFGIKYGGIEHKGLDGKDIPKAISFGNFTAKLRLGFLTPFSSKILQKINTPEKLIKDDDGLNPKEKNVIMNKLGKAVLGENYKPSYDKKKNQEQFKTQKAEDQIKDFYLKLQQNPSKINNFLNKLV